MKKLPLLKLMGVLKQLDESIEEVPGYIVDGIVDYLDGCACCAFCKNYGKHDPCDPDNKDLDFEPFDKNEGCCYFLDKRDDEKYRLPNGLTRDFYREILHEQEKQK